MLLTLDQARTALVTTEIPVRLMDENGKDIRVTSDPIEVIDLLSAGVHQFGGSKSRVKWIKIKGPIPEPRQAPLPEPVAVVAKRLRQSVIDRLVPWNWRSDEAAVFPPWPDFGLRPEQGRVVEA